MCALFSVSSCAFTIWALALATVDSSVPLCLFLPLSSIILYFGVIVRAYISNNFIIIFCLLSECWSAKAFGFCCSGFPFRSLHTTCFMMPMVWLLAVAKLVHVSECCTNGLSLFSLVSRFAIRLSWLLLLAVTSLILIYWWRFLPSTDLLVYGSITYCDCSLARAQFFSCSLSHFWCLFPLSHFIVALAFQQNIALTLVTSINAVRFTVFFICSFVFIEKRATHIQQEQQQQRHLNTILEK